MQRVEIANIELRTSVVMLEEPGRVRNMLCIISNIRLLFSDL